MKQFDLVETITFGQYKGYKIGNVIEQDARYIQWCLNNVSFFTLTKRSVKKLTEHLACR